MNQLPGIMFECGSNPDPRARHHLRSDLTRHDRGPRWFFINKVRPMLDGNPPVFFHRLFGEFVSGDAQDFNAIGQLMNGWMEDEYYAKLALIELKNLSETDSKVYVYLGSLRSNWFKNLLNRMRYTRWSHDIADEMRYYHHIGGDFYFVFDEASAYKENSIQWRMVRLLERTLKNPIAIEAMPKYGYKHHYDYPSFVNESLYLFSQFESDGNHYRTKEMLRGGLTRWLNLRDYNQYYSGCIEKFVCDCSERGHRCFITDTVYNRIGLTPKQLQERVNA